MPIIIGVSDGRETSEQNLDKSPIVFGRLAKSDVCVKNSQVSRRHAQIVAEGGDYYIQDLDSSNGVYVNQLAIVRSKISHGDTFNVGGVADFIFLLHPDPALTRDLLKKLKSSPEGTSAAYSMRKTVKQLVVEVTKVTPPAETGEGPAAAHETLPSPVAAPAAAPPAAPSGAASGLGDLEGLLQISYTLNSTLSLKQVLETLLGKVLEILKAQRGFILLKSSKSRELEVKFARDKDGPLDDSSHETFPRNVAVQAAADGITLDSSRLKDDLGSLNFVDRRFHDLEFIVTPLKVKNSTIGALYVDRPGAAGPFSRRDALYFEALCHQAAIAIDNARLTEDLKDKQRRLKVAYDEVLDKNSRLQITNETLDQKVAELAALNAVSRGLNMVSTLDQVLKLILEKTVELLGVEKGSLLLVNEETDCMELKAIVGVDTRQPISKSTRLRVGEGIAGLALRQGVPVAINDGAKNPQFKMFLPEDASIRSLLCVPLIVANRKIGVINLTNRLSGAGFGENDKALVSTMASQAAITIENARLYNLAIFDGLTSLYVARYFHLFLEKEFHRVRRYGGQVALVMADLDNFKSINDTHGHQVGDVVLQKVSQLIRASVRTNDVPARYGGEEFALILPETDLDGASIFSERLRKKVEETPVKVRERTLTVTISIGVASFPGCTAQNKTQLIALADRSLLEAKRNGRNQVVLAPARPLDPSEPAPPEDQEEPAT
ncbi:MAG: diguanylate cyclase [Candidatus Riflebacteria bacterium]|nr:diguanylate cyclase [Candidatus Riflebacteria bacterium]